MLHGEAGVGKSALLQWSRDRAIEFNVLEAGGVPIESGLPFAGLATLLEPLRDRLDELPAPQAAAMRSVFALGPPVATTPFVTYAAARSMLELAARTRPVLVLVDDAHWLDEESLDALLFIARRVASVRAAMLMTVRDGDGRPVEDHGLAEIVLRGLAAGDALDLLADSDPRLAPSVARALVAGTGGNPLALLEATKLLTEAQRAGSTPLEDPLTPGPALERAFACTLDRLEPPVRAAVLVAAAADDDDLETIVRALDASALGLATLAQAEAAGIVQLSGDRVAFRHPLVRSAA